MSEHEGKPPFDVERRGGAPVFAAAFLAGSLFLLSQIGAQTVWVSSGAFYAQPRLWPAISLIGMVVFGLLHLIGTLRSRSEGHAAEVRVWLGSLEYAVWFLVYVLVVPLAGYLPSTLIFTTALVWRSGYRSRRALAAAVVLAVAVVVFFKTLLQVRVPAGEIYEYLPAGLRGFMMTYF